MHTNDVLPAVEKGFVTFISGWEFAALTTGRVPPITAVVRPLPKPAKAAIIGGAVSWFTAHLWKDPD